MMGSPALATDYGTPCPVLDRVAATDPSARPFRGSAGPGESVEMAPCGMGG